MNNITSQEVPLCGMLGQSTAHQLPMQYTAHSVCCKLPNPSIEGLQAARSSRCAVVARAVLWASQHTGQDSTRRCGGAGPTTACRCTLCTHRAHRLGCCRSQHRLRLWPSCHPGIWSKGLAQRHKVSQRLCGKGPSQYQKPRHIWTNMRRYGHAGGLTVGPQNTGTTFLHSVLREGQSCKQHAATAGHA
jgi:hypothetical protein